MPPFETLYKKR